MAGYAKLWSGITESSLWDGSKEARLLFVSMLARADSVGFVEAAPSGLARIANLTKEEVASALEELTSPDPESKSKVADGKRVAVVPRGFCVVNYEEYRARRDDDERREYMRQYMREYRAEKKRVNKCVNSSKSSKPGLAQAEAEAEAEAITTSATPSAPLLPEVVNGKPHPKGRKSKKFDIPALAFTEDQEATFEKIWKAWPSEGWNFSSKSAQPRRINKALAMRRFKEILDNFPRKIDGGPITADHLADASLAFIAKRKAESPGQIPNVPCIANFFSSEEVSKKQWQDALMEYFGETV